MIEREIGSVFVPVSDIAAARDWYCRLLGIAPMPPILFGHLCVLPMTGGSGLALDAKGYSGPHDRKPAFHFNTRDITAAHAYLREMGVAVDEAVTDGVFFNFRDPDGNLLMVADVPPAPRG